MNNQPARRSGRQPDEIAEQTRQRIVDRARAIFAAHGFEGVSLRDIAAQAGVTHPAATPAEAAKTVLGGAATVPPLVLVDGFDYLHAGELRLVVALSQAADVLLAIDPSAVRGHIVQVSAEDWGIGGTPAAQVRAAEIRQRAEGA